jgi:predicted DNA-binding protein
VEVLFAMTLLRRRDKMVSIRLSDEEFMRVREACRTKGARSVSDLARDAICRLVAGPAVREINGQDGLGARVEDLDHRINYLQEQVSRLATFVRNGEG